jgi:hypothetical protein
MGKTLIMMCMLLIFSGCALEKNNTEKRNITCLIDKLPIYDSPDVVKIKYIQNESNVTMNKDDFFKAMLASRTLRLNCYKYRKINKEINEYIKKLKEDRK